jgi:hypothetical protein
VTLTTDIICSQSKGRFVSHLAARARTPLRDSLRARKLQRDVSMSSMCLPSRAIYGMASTSTSLLLRLVKIQQWAANSHVHIGTGGSIPLIDLVKRLCFG